jgi:hypothetical protein
MKQGHGGRSCRFGGREPTLPSLEISFPHNSRRIRLIPQDSRKSPANSAYVSLLFAMWRRYIIEQFLLGVQEVPSSNLGGPTNRINQIRAFFRAAQNLLTIP